MKKFVIILLLILPIFLMVTISLVGQMLATITFINVESVAFVDDLENEISSIKVGKGKNQTLIVKVLPTLANNKKLTFKSLDEEIAEVDKSGVVSGINYGYTTIIVESVDGKKTDRLTINVTDEAVESVNIDLSEKQLYLHEQFTLTHSVSPFTAVDKKVIWTSSHPEYVEVSATGVITAKKLTEENMTVTITATTRDGNFTDTCEITVIPYLLAFKAQVDEDKTSEIYNTLTLDLMSLIYFDDSKISEDEIFFTIDRGEDYASITGKTLTFNEEFAGQPVRLVCRATNEDINVEIKMYIGYTNN